jgi:hypothetical protein
LRKESYNKMEKQLKIIFLRWTIKKRPLTSPSHALIIY